MLWVPNTTSTQGARATIVARSFWAMQPPTAICMSGFAVLAGRSWPRLPYSLLSAFSRTAQVLKTTTSAVSGGSDTLGDVDVAGGLQQPGEPLGVMHIHLAPVGAHVIGPHRIDKGTCSPVKARSTPSPCVRTFWDGVSMSDQPLPLTLAESRDRARLVAVSGYAVDLDLTRGPEVFRSRTVACFRCNSPGATTFVELRAARLVSATLNGRPLDSDRLTANRLTLEGLQADNELVVEADMPYARTGEGMHRFVDPLDAETYVCATSASTMPNGSSPTSTSPTSRRPSPPA